jgi:hypothetical protein
MTNQGLQTNKKINKLIYSEREIYFEYLQVGEIILLK